MNILVVRLSFIFLLFVFVIQIGCATRKPAYFDPVAFGASDTAVNIMPILDARTDKSVAFTTSDFLNLLQDAKEVLEKKGYKTTISSGWPGNKLSGIEFSTMDTEEMCTLLPTKPDNNVVILVNEIHDSFTGLTSSYTLAATAFLISKARQKLIWKDYYVRTKSEAGVVAAVIEEGLKKHSVKMFFMEGLFETLPSPSG